MFSGLSVHAEELCDCYGKCIPVHPRNVSNQIKKMVKIRDHYSPKSRVDIDHILPLCLGGTNDINNLQALDRAEHALKTEHDMLMLFYVHNCFMTVDEARNEDLNWSLHNLNKNFTNR